jgi:hypothetical protein
MVPGFWNGFSRMVSSLPTTSATREPWLMKVPAPEIVPDVPWTRLFGPNVPRRWFQRKWRGQRSLQRTGKLDSAVGHRLAVQKPDEVFGAEHKRAMEGNAAAEVQVAAEVPVDGHLFEHTDTSLGYQGGSSTSSESHRATCLHRESTSRLPHSV